MSKRGKSAPLTLGESFVMFIVAIVIMCGVFAWSGNECEDKGGHLVTGIEYRYPVCQDDEGRILK